MAVYRSLRTLISQNPKTKLSRIFLTLAFPSPIPLFPSPSPSHFLSHPPRVRSLYPLSNSIIPFHGPLFLSSPPWMLSQSSTPLYVQSDLVLLPRVHGFNLLRRPSFPINFGLESVSSVPKLLNLTGTKGSSDSKVGGFVESFVNLPNLISMSRLVSGPFLGWMILHEMYIPAFVGLAISGATDWLDGYVARRMGINSVIGSYLDPLADKVLIGCVALAMVDMGLLHLLWHTVLIKLLGFEAGLVGLVVLRDVALIGGAAYKRASSLDWEWKSWFDFFNIDGTRPLKVEPLFISKVNTVFQLVLVAAVLLQPEFGTPRN
ncbi:hypothetical protein HYC85_018387 [Camellia sinensis]|uniref:Uncharacterized protein n=1 Tax=Camellia sinensis TaxID=4442 RepID=A0A7J7GUH2_CAMSI|nr:hypothetical protein HYC85_018387 [Camellia sinensis]